MSEIEAVAKAVEKTADLGTQALQTGEKAGGFVARVFKEPIESAVSMLTDRLRVMRLRNWDRMADEVDEILTRRGVTDTRAVSPKIGITLLEDAAIEDEPELQVLWTRLLANAMDPNFGDVRVAFSEIIKGMSPLDASVLFALYQSLSNEDRADLGKAKSKSFNEELVRVQLQATPDEFSVAVDNLMRLRCVVTHTRRAGLGNGLKSDGGEIFFAVESKIPAISITPLGVKFVEACSDQGLRAESTTITAERDFTHKVESTFEMRVGNF